jgi:ribosomal protein S18 acetylase RimI-like enzyme
MVKVCSEEKMFYRPLTGQDSSACISIQKELKVKYPFPIGGSQCEWVNGDFSGWGVHDSQGILLAYLIYSECASIFEILDLAVHPFWQRQGIMSGLLRTVIEKVPSGSNIWLDVHEGNLAALSFYKKIGFAAVGRRERYYSDGRAALLLSYYR